MTKRFLRTSVALAATATVMSLVGCGPTPVAKTSASPVVSATPAVVVTATPVVSATPVVAVSATPVVVVTATPVETGSPAVSAIPTTSLAPTTPDVNAYATIRGRIVDDNNADLDGVTLTAKSLNTAKPYEGTATSSAGSYSFTGVPTGVTIEIAAVKAGYTTRTRTIVPLVNNQGGSTINDMNFGQNADGTQNVTTALSDKPEVINITPNFNTSGVNPGSSFVLKFSEPMDKTSVEEAFIIRNRENYTFSLSQKIGGVHQVVYNKSTYDITWNTAKDEVTLAPKNSQTLPSDKDSSKVPSYYASFSGPVKDAAGTLSRGINAARATDSDTGIEPTNSTTDGPFRVTSVFKTGSPFSISTDTTAPKVDSVWLVSSYELKAKFSEPMKLFPVNVLDSTNYPFGDKNVTDTSYYELRTGDGQYWDDSAAIILSTTATLMLDGNDLTNRTIKFTGVDGNLFKVDIPSDMAAANIVSAAGQGKITGTTLASGIEFATADHTIVGTTVGSVNKISVLNATADTFKLGQKILIAKEDGTNRVVSDAADTYYYGFVKSKVANGTTKTDISYYLIHTCGGDAAVTGLASATPIKYDLKNLKGLRLQIRIATGKDIKDPAGNSITTDADKKADTTISL